MITTLRPSLKGRHHVKIEIWISALIAPVSGRRLHSECLRWQSETDPYEAYGVNRRCDRISKTPQQPLRPLRQGGRGSARQAEQELDNAKRRALFKQILHKHFEDGRKSISATRRAFIPCAIMARITTSGDDVYRCGRRHESYLVDK